MTSGPIYLYQYSVRPKIEIISATMIALDIFSGLKIWSISEMQKLWWVSPEMLSYSSCKFVDQLFYNFNKTNNSIKKYSFHFFQYRSEYPTKAGIQYHTVCPWQYAISWRHVIGSYNPFMSSYWINYVLVLRYWWGYSLLARLYLPAGTLNWWGISSKHALWPLVLHSLQQININVKPPITLVEPCDIINLQHQLKTTMEVMMYTSICCRKFN